MKKTLYLVSLCCTVLLAACQDESEETVTPTAPTEDPVEATDSGDEPTASDQGAPTTAGPKAPTLEARGLPQSHLISVAAIVKEDQADGTIHYAAFKESVHPGKLTAQELMNSPYRDEFPMNGNTERGFTVPASSKTKYFVYALVQVGDKISEVAELELETI